LRKKTQPRSKNTRSRTTRQRQPRNTKRSRASRSKTSKTTPGAALLFLLLIAALIGGLYFFLAPPFNPTSNKDTLPVTVSRQPRPGTRITWFSPNSKNGKLCLSSLQFPDKLSRNERARKIIRQLATPKPKSSNPLPKDTRLLRANFSPPLLTIDLNRKIISGTQDWGTADELTAVTCLTRSLLDNFPDCRQIQILIEGQKLQTLAGHIDISHPLSYQ
jgi:hypothetical protein